MRHTKRVWLFTASALALAPQLALADTPAASTDNGSGDIVVTAQRREQNLQDVGIAISAFSGDTLKKMGVQSSTDIARLTPGVSISASGGGQDSQFSIRGVTQNDFSDAIEAPVAVYVDETYIPNLNGQIFGTFDLQRVEVLKGPQGTLFGRNATGGLVHFIPVKPSDKPNAYAEVTYGAYNHVRVEAAIGLPLSDTVQFRVSGLYNRNTGYLKNLYPAGTSSLTAGSTAPQGGAGADLGGENSKAVRAQLQFEPTDRLTVRLTGSYLAQHLSVNPYNSTGTRAVYDSQGRVVNVVFANGDSYGYNAPGKQSLEVSSDWSIPDRNRLFAWDTAVHINYQLDGAEIVAISDYRHFRKDYGTDVDAGPENLIDFISDSVEHSFSQELRIAGTKKGPVRWVAGAYFLDINSLVHNGFKAPSNSVFAAYYPGYAQSGIDLINDVNLKTESISAFAQGEYDFAPKLTLILGGRIIHEHQDYTFDSMAHANTNDYEFTYGPALFQLQDPYANKRNTLMWAGKAQVEYRPAKGTLLYFGVNRGVKGGAYNAQLPDGSASLSPSRIAYNPETLVAYEAGLKTGFWHNMLTLDLSGYYYDYHNYQAFTFSNVSGIVSNNDARNFGMEASLNLRPARGLNIGLGLSLIDAKVKHVAIATGIYKDVRPTFTPAKTLAAQIGYTLPEQLAGGDINFNIDGSWRSKVYANIRNFDADIINPYFLANMHVYWNRGPLRLGIGVENMFDERYKTVTYDLATLCGCNEESYGMPRWWNVSLRYTY